MDRGTRIWKLSRRALLFIGSAYLLLFPGNDAQDHRVGGIGFGILLIDFILSRDLYKASKPLDNASPEPPA